MPEPPAEPDPADVAADDRLLDDLIAGATPPDDDQVAQLLATWHREVQR